MSEQGFQRNLSQNEQKCLILAEISKQQFNTIRGITGTHQSHHPKGDDFHTFRHLKGADFTKIRHLCRDFTIFAEQSALKT